MSAFNTHRIETPAGQLFVREDGVGDPLILWPSIFTDGHVYDLIVPLLDGYRVIRIDGPGHGRSGPPAANDVASHGTSMLAVMNALGIERAVVGGTSWGGIVAAHAALQSPERVSAALLLNTPLELGTAPSLAQRFIAWGARYAPGAGVFRNGVAKSFFSDSSLTQAPDYAHHFHAMLQGADNQALGAAVRAVLLDGPPLATLLPCLKVPTLMIAGRADPMYPLEQQEAAAKTLAKGTFAVVRGKHISAVDAPNETAAAILEFLSDSTQLSTANA